MIDKPEENMDVVHGSKKTLRSDLTKYEAIKDVIVICTGQLIFFTAYTCLAMLQSTMNHKGGIGVWSQGIMYACFCISSVLFPKYFIKKFGSKRVLVCGLLTHIPYVAFNFYPHWILMIPTSIMIGLGAAVFWGSLATYVNDLSLLYTDLVIDRRNNLCASAVVSQEQKEIVQNEQHDSESSRDIIDNVQSVKCSTRVVDDANESEYRNFDSKGAQRTTISNSSKNDQSRKKNSHREQFLHVPNDAHKCELKEFISGDTPASLDDLNHVISYSSNIVTEKSMLTDLIPLRGRDMTGYERLKLVGSTTALFFGFQGMTFHFSQVCGNLLSYFILKNDMLGEILSNSSCICGAGFCNTQEVCFETSLAVPDENIRFLLTGICISLQFIALVIIAIFLDSLEDENEDALFSMQFLMATYRIGKTKDLLLLVPFSFYVGMLQGFYIGDITKAYIGCAWGTFHIGLVTVCYGTASGLSSTLAGYLVKRLGRVPVFSFAEVVNVTAIILLLLWKPNKEAPSIFFLLAGLWGVNLGASLSQLKALYGIFFKEKEEEAFASFYAWYSLGFFLSFAYSDYLCAYIKVYMLFIVSSFGFVGYLTVERLHWHNKVTSLSQ